MEKLVFKEYSKRKHDKNSVWNSFLRTEDGLHAKCKLCHKILQCSNTTTCLHNHLKKQHPHSLDSRRYTLTTSATESTANAMSSTSSNHHLQEKIPPKKARIDDFFYQKEQSLESIIAKMTACDGLSFNVICKSESIRLLFNKSGYSNLPKSGNTIQKIVLEKSNQRKIELKKELASLKANGRRFSVSLDEWSSARNRRYMNINIHCPFFPGKSFQNLGLARVTGRATSIRCLDILKEKLISYDLSLDDDIAGLVTDGASVMTAMGRQTLTYHQLCLAHGIQCAVVDVVYKNQYDKEESPECLEQAINIAESSDDESSDENEGFAVDHRLILNQPIIHPDYKDLINKVRKVVKLFKKSPTKTEMLQKYLAEEHKSAGLVLDCKTRWNSMADMVSRFLLIKDAIFKSLIDLKETITFSEEELGQLKDLSLSLGILKTTVEALCLEKANLLTAETALKFMVGKLEENSGDISKKLLQALKTRISQRRNRDLVSTLQYLHNPSKYYDAIEQKSSDMFPYASIVTITHIIAEINNRYYHQRCSSDDEDDQALICLVRQRVEDEEEARTSNLSLKEQLQKKLDEEMTAVSKIKERNDLVTSIKMEMALYDGGAPRQIHLNQAYDVLLSIPPTSVECERIFSASKFFCSHLRTRLNDVTIDALSFLRSHYQSI